MKIPNKKVRRRDEKLLEYCKGKKVLHVGACDSPFTKDKFDGKLGPFLYREIDKVCTHQLGIDLDQESVEFLNSKKREFPNSESRFVDMNKLEELNYTPDVIIFGEVIEHIMNLETALSNLKKVMSKDTLLIISTPNAYCFEGIIANLFGHEVFHVDHKVYFTYGMLTNLLHYNSLNVQDGYFCKLGHHYDNLHGKILNIVGDYIIYHLFPRFYNNLLFIVRLK